MGKFREKAGTGLCECQHLAEVHQIAFQTIYAIKRGRCTVEGCACHEYVRNQNCIVVRR